MIKKVLLLIALVALSGACFFPVTQQKTILIRSPFLNLYSFLSNPQKWEKWRPDLQGAFNTDSASILVRKDSTAFTIKYHQLKLAIKPKGASFAISDRQGDKTTEYSYLLLPGKQPRQTQVTVFRETNVAGYLAGKFRANAFADTHITELKNFIENDSLYYGFNIFKTGVPGGFLIVKQKEVAEQDKFTGAANLLAALKLFIKINNAKPIQPVIAQFNQNIKDSVQVKVGFFINKEVKSGNGIEFNRMPKGGPLYAIRFKGEFSKRARAYDALKQYFADHSHQLVILPFETYLDDKLPVTDADTVNIQINFATFPSAPGAK